MSFVLFLVFFLLQCVCVEVWSVFGRCPGCYIHSWVDCWQCCVWRRVCDLGTVWVWGAAPLLHNTCDSVTCAFWSFWGVVRNFITLVCSVQCAVCSVQCARAFACEMLHDVMAVGDDDVQWPLCGGSACTVFTYTPRLVPPSHYPRQHAVVNLFVPHVVPTVAPPCFHCAGPAPPCVFRVVGAMVKVITFVGAAGIYFLSLNLYFANKRAAGARNATADKPSVRDAFHAAAAPRPAPCSFAVGVWRCCRLVPRVTSHTASTNRRTHTLWQEQATHRRPPLPVYLRC